MRKISKGNTTVVDVDFNNSHELKMGEWVTFSEVQGMVQINEIEKIKVVNILNDKSFEIDLDSSNFDDYTGQGKV